jgi:enoyl-CoA hydratase/carnithine racemase
LFRALERLDKVVIAAINGNAISIGCELALACDVRYMAEEAPSIGLPEITLGIIPGGGGTQRLARTVGRSRALELILEGRLLTPDEALVIGLVDQIVPRARLVEESVETAHRLARRAPISVAAAKRALYEGASRSLRAGLAVERRWFLASVSRRPARKALRTYVDEARGREHAPWEDAAARENWREGRAVDLLSRDDE